LHTPGVWATGAGMRHRGAAGTGVPGGTTDAATAASVTLPHVRYVGSRGVWPNAWNENGRRTVLKPSSLRRHATVAKSATTAFWTLPQRPSTIVWPFSKPNQLAPGEQQQQEEKAATATATAATPPTPAAPSSSVVLPL